MNKKQLFKMFSVAMLMTLPLSKVAAESDNLVYFVKGTIPLLITAPHGGSGAPDSVSIRTGVDSNGVAIEDFNIVKDSWTKSIAKDIQAKYVQKYGGVPYLVAADFHRKYIDANRPEHQAFESETARIYYDTYHNKINEFIADIQQKFGQGLLLDIHGQAQHPDKILRGTRNGYAVENLVGKYGWDAIVGNQGIFGLLAQQGFSLQPTNSQIPNNSNLTPESSLSGGTTIKFNGSHNAFGIDAIQFELGSNIRFSSAERALFADHMADNIRTFMKTYYCNGSVANYPCSPKTILVDRDHKGYYESNDWEPSNAVDNYPIKNLSKSRYANQAGEVTRWRSPVQQTGNYNVFAWWTNTKSDGSKYTRDSSAEYKISAGSNNLVVIKNQNVSGGQWVLLGTIAAVQGESIQVSLTREHDGDQGSATVADAMSFVWAGQ